MFTKMLVPLDGSEVSEAVLSWVSTLAQGLDIPVVLLAITDPGGPSLSFLRFAADERHYAGIPIEVPRGGLPTAPTEYQYIYSDDDNPKKGAVEEMFQLEEWLRERASFLESQGVNVLEEKVLGAHDKPSRVILQFAQEHGCDFIAMASHGSNLLEQAFKGSVISGVIHSSETPVMAISPEESSEIPDQPLGSLSRLSVLLDGSEFAEAALPYVSDLASRLSLEVVLVRWLTNEQLYPAYAGTGVELLNADRLKAEVEQEISEETNQASSYLQAITDDLIQNGIKARWQIAGATADSGRSELIQDCVGSMIVLASHGRTGMLRWLEGSVAEELLKDSNCPLMIIPPALAQEDESE